MPRSKDTVRKLELIVGCQGFWGLYHCCDGTFKGKLILKSSSVLGWVWWKESRNLFSRYLERETCRLCQKPISYKIVTSGVKWCL